MNLWETRVIIGSSLRIGDEGAAGKKSSRAVVSRSHFLLKLQRKELVYREWPAQTSAVAITTGKRHGKKEKKMQVFKRRVTATEKALQNSTEGRGSESDKRESAEGVAYHQLRAWRGGKGREDCCAIPHQRGKNSGKSRRWGGPTHEKKATPS